MIYIIKNAWALLIGMLLLMIGNGLQGTLLGIRGSIEGFSPATMSYVMSAYMIGMLLGSRAAPLLIQNVGHVRVFAALASLISAVFIGFAVWVDPVAWFLFRLVVVFCFSGVYVVAESWLNDSSTNENRGKTMSAYMVVQMLGITIAQVIVNFADPSTFILFALISILVSISFAPILLSVSKVPVFNTSKKMSLSKLYETSPLCCIGMILLGSIFSLLFGMTAVFGSEKGFSVSEISILVGSIYVAGLLSQYPIGYFSDRVDRRLLIIYISSFAFLFLSLGMIMSNNFYFVMFIFVVAGSLANPLYSIFIAYTNDYLESGDMASAAGGLVFMSGIGGIFSPILAGQLMVYFGPDSFIYSIIFMFFLIAIFGIYRSTRRSSLDTESATSHVAIMPQATNVAVEISQEKAIEEADSIKN